MSQEKVTQVKLWWESKRVWAAVLTGLYQALYSVMNIEARTGAKTIAEMFHNILLSDIISVVMAVLTAVLVTFFGESVVSYKRKEG